MKNRSSINMFHTRRRIKVMRKMADEDGLDASLLEITRVNPYSNIAIGQSEMVKRDGGQMRPLSGIRLG